uniref:Uncharacterized protein n=1 Tax=Cyanistes caeruleus TaxID=156563 RepID=A0A8C0VKX9_CYACU
FNWVRGISQTLPKPTGKRQKLCDRVASSTLLDDRRDAVRALKSLSKVSSRLPQRRPAFQRFFSTVFLSNA